MESGTETIKQLHRKTIQGGYLLLAGVTHKLSCLNAMSALLPHTHGYSSASTARSRKERS